MPAPAAPATPQQHTMHSTYPGDIAQISAVRADLQALLRDCPTVDQAILCASGLAANAARHSNSCMPGGHFTVRATARPCDHIQIEVTDDGGPWHRADHPDQHHGLDIVHALAADWGINGDYRTRTIWARLRWPADPQLSRFAAAADRGQLSALLGEMPPAEDPSPAPAITGARYTGRVQWTAVIDSQRLRHLRRLHDLSRQKLASRAGISVATLARLEREPRPHCHPQTMSRLVTALGEHPATITRTVTPTPQHPPTGTATA